MSDKLRLRATDAEDLAVIAACLQDGRVSLKEMVFSPQEHRFMAAFTRYRRERLKDRSSCVGLTECQAAVIFEGIADVKYRGLDADEPSKDLVLLTIATVPGREHLIHINLVFEGDAQIQLRTDQISCRLEDFGAAQPCRITPCDHLGQEWVGAARS